MRRTSAQDQIALQGLDVGEGHARRGECPYCGSGQSFRLSRYDNILFYRCYRASCGQKGAIPLAPGAMSGRTRAAPVQAFKEPLSAIPPWANERVMELYGIADIARYARWSEAYGLVFEIVDMYNQPTGYHSKNLPGRWPKTHTWWTRRDAPILYFPDGSPTCRTPDASTCIVLVEGALDAIKVRKAGFWSAALCGSDISIEQAKYLKRIGVNDVELMLDADTWHHAKPGKLRDQYGLYFDNFRLIPTDYDPKDTPIDDLRRNIDGWINRETATCSDPEQQA